MNLEQGAFSQVPEKTQEKEADLDLPKKSESEKGVWGRLKTGVLGIVGAGAIMGAQDVEAFDGSKGSTASRQAQPLGLVEKATRNIESVSSTNLTGQLNVDMKTVIDLSKEDQNISLFKVIIKNLEDLKSKLSIVDLKTVKPEDRAGWNKQIEETQRLLVVFGKKAREIGQSVWKEIETKGLDGVKPEDRVKIAPIRDEANKWFEVQEQVERLSRELPTFSRHQVEEGGNVK
jgi:hypothetical protein